MKPNLSALGYRFGAMRVVEYRGESAEDISGESVKMNFNVQVGFGISLEPPMILIMPEITCALLDNPEREMCYLKLHTAFPIEGLEAYVESNEIKLPEDFLGTLINLSVGAARGVLYAKNLGMRYENVVMPPMNMQDLLPKEPFRFLNEAHGVKIGT